MEKSLFCKTIFVLLCIQIFIILPVYTQNLDSDASDFTLDGVWENPSHFVEIKNSTELDMSMDIIFKPFYQYWYDGIYTTKYIPEKNSIARLHNGLYLEYWIKGSAFDSKNISILESSPYKSKGTFWRPGGNLKEISLDKPKIQKELTGYYVLRNENTIQIYVIRYWISTVAYSKDQASISLDKTDSNDPLVLFVDKYLKINGAVYTCATGRRSVIRNIQTITELPGTPLYSIDETLMVLNSPYLVLSEIINISDEIAKHNAITYPPHSGEAHFVEPSVYTKMENNELPLNGGSYFKSGYENMKTTDTND